LPQFRRIVGHADLTKLAFTIKQRPTPIVPTQVSEETATLLTV